MLEIHISRSTWFAMATTNKKRLKKMNFDYSRSKFELGTSGVKPGLVPVDKLQRENNGIDAIFPIL